MAKLIPLCFILLLGIFPKMSAAASPGDDQIERVAPPFYVYSEENAPGFSIYQSRINISFNYPEGANEGDRIYMSINGLLEDVTYTPGGVVTFDLSPGKYQFKIWGGPGFDEIVTDSIQCNAQKIYNAAAQMNRTRVEIMVLKPVIYFHTDETIDFSAAVVPNGDFTFTYPAIEQGWKGSVAPDGSLTVNGQNYPYFFWESDQQYTFRSTTNGYHLKKEDYVAFLEKKCRELGFNDREKTDFITFWGMKMQEHEELFVQFVMDDACNAFATMEIVPQPDAVKRVYICLTPWDEVFSPYLNDETFEPMAAEGFTVLEWGGYTFELPENSFTNL